MIANMHLTTIAVSAIPGALLIVAMYRLFRREAVSREEQLERSTTRKS